MKNIMRKSEIAALVVISISFLTSAYFYPQMPESMASHWNIEGEVDGYTPRAWWLSLMPIMTVGLFSLFVIIPRIDPLKQNIAKFRKYFDVFFVLLMLFLFYLHSLTVLWNLGLRFDIIRALVPAFSALFFYLGILVENAKRNWSVGIRTPWTLSSDKVWDRTHRAGGRLFKITGLIALAGLAFEDYSFYLIILPVIAVAIYTFAYSYFEYKRLKK